MAKFRDYYRILGVAPEATADEIKAAYRKLARKFHPDVNKEKDAHARFVEIGEAYEALGDPQKRAAYDQLRKAGFQDGQEMDLPPPGAQARGGAGGTAGFEGFGGDFGGGHYTEVDPEAFSDFFQSLFGRAQAGAGGRRSRRAAFEERGDDVHHQLEVTLDEAYRGGARRVQLQVPELDQHGRVRHATRTLDVKIPAGVTDGAKIRLRGQGLPGSTPELNGDLYFEIALAADPRFKVDGHDVHLELPIAPWEAVLGASVSVPTLGGSVTMRIPPGSRAGDKLRLRARGLPGETPGDEIVTLAIAVPAQVSERERELWRQLQQASGFDARAGLGGAA
jgi:curved DNA-binding protein